MISPFGITTVPAGWLYCNGDTLGNGSSGATNASDDFEALFDLIKNLWGNSGGTFSAGNTINLPNLKGSFLRGIDTGVISSRNKVGPTNVGDYQEDKFQGHRHAFANYEGGTNPFSNNQEPISGSGRNPQYADLSVGGVFDPKTDGSNGTPRTGLDTHPYNAGVKYCIKF